MTEATAFYEQQRSQAFAEDESWFQLAVEIQANGALAGDVGIHFLDHGRQAELGMTFSLRISIRGMPGKPYGR